jgi:hypothetical protein
MAFFVLKCKYNARARFAPMPRTPVMPFQRLIFYGQTRIINGALVNSILEYGK